MAAKKPDLAAGLAASASKPEIRRGTGMRLSTEDATNAETQNRIKAESQNSEIAPSQKSEPAKPQGPKRVNRGYMLREDLIKEFKLIAVREDRNMYEVMEQALQEYLERRKTG